MNEILEAKRNLYHLLLNRDNSEITENEWDIMYLLAKDEQIQSLLKQYPLTPNKMI